jgi:acyl-coenzyme A thioesterase PaaI-like protein
MFNPDTIFKKAAHSSFYLWLMNRALNRLIPFNGPHSFEVLEVSPNHIRTKLPFKRKNLNHLKGLHACALATLSEITGGLLLISRLGFKNYRIILKELKMEYHYQGKTNAYANFEVEEAWMKTEVINVLEEQGEVTVPCVVKSYDEMGNHICTGTTYWQIKTWQKVKTKINA